MNITNNVVAFKTACVQIISFPQASAAGKRTYVFLSSGSGASWLVILAMSASTSSKRSDTGQAALGDLEEAVVVVRQTMRGVPDASGRGASMKDSSTRRLSFHRGTRASSRDVATTRPRVRMIVH
ncbi:hypothetical protein [Mycolicibacterium mengxianglii]|uniref:hypothetical protein n=1 Tax=Mycolicibacterium mengxianglii TaxID=2736649 RepID=UPI0018EED0C5|nr:hypothetical protein [Mycolicibacterium mengxianglii]